MRLLLSLIASICWASAALSQGLGIDFAHMPVGTKFYYEDYEGDKWVETYRGKFGKFYEVAVAYPDTNFNLRRKYDQGGHLVQVRHSSGYTLYFSPRSCEQVVGECTHSVRGPSKYAGTYKYSLHPAGNAYIQKFGSVSTNERFESRMVFGTYNKLKEETWEGPAGTTRYRRLVRIEAP